MSEELKRLIADDAYAASFQTMGQYRSALLKAADSAQDVARAPLTEEQRIAIQECIDYLTPAAKEFSDLGITGMVDSKHARCIRTLRSLLVAKAELSSAVPVGWQIVPSVATEEMADAGNKAMLRHWANGIYEAMLAAAPAALAVAPHDDARDRIASALHYPACWDTAAYPTLESAAWEAIACAKLGCSTCEATAPTMSEAVRDVHGAQALLHDAACECMSPEQMDKYEALFVGADDLPLRFLRCVLKRIDRANAEGEKS